MTKSLQFSVKLGEDGDVNKLLRAYETLGSAGEGRTLHETMSFDDFPSQKSSRSLRFRAILAIQNVLRPLSFCRQRSCAKRALGVPVVVIRVARLGELSFSIT